MGLPGSFIFASVGLSFCMNSRFYLWLPLILALGACSEKSDTSSTASSPTNSSSASSPLDAPAGYLGALARGQQTAVSTIDTASLDKAIQLFSVENGRNPKDLNELVDQKFIPKIPATPYGTKLVYDSTSGKVSIVKQ